MLRKRMNSQRRETHNRSDEREGGHGIHHENREKERSDPSHQRRRTVIIILGVIDLTSSPRLILASSSSVVKEKRTPLLDISFYMRYPVLIPSFLLDSNRDADFDYNRSIMVLLQCCAAVSPSEASVRPFTCFIVE